MTPDLTSDVIVIGGGAAGLFCAAEAGRRGRSVVLVERAERVGAAPEQRVGVRRTLSNLAVGLGEEAVQKASSEWTFQAAETLYGLSVIPLP